jgi:hypothetical protein
LDLTAGQRVFANKRVDDAMVDFCADDADRLAFEPGTLSIEDPDGTRISATPCVMSRTVRTSDKSGMSSRTTARSTLPAAISLAASSAEPVSITFKRILEPVVASPLAMADMRRTTSSSGEPTATVRVSGRVT